MCKSTNDMANRNLKSGVFLLSVCVVLSSVRADVFPNIGGTGDFTDPDAWGTPLPSVAEFDAEGPFNATKGDATFSAFVNLAGSRVFDLTATPSRKITVNGTGDAWRIANSDTSVELKGGVWDLKNKGNFLITNGVVNCSLTLSDGCVVTNAVGLQVSYARDANSKIVIKDRSQLHCQMQALAVCYGKATNCNSRIEVRSGALFRDAYTSTVWIDRNGGTAVAHTGVGLLVTDEDSRAEFVGNVYLGEACHLDNWIRVADGAWLRTKTLYIGYGNSCGSNVVTVSSATMTNDAVYVGCAATPTYPNRLEYVNGATGLVKGTMAVGGKPSDSTGASRSELLVSNSTLTANNVLVGNGVTSSNNVAIFTGKSTVLKTTQTSNYSLFGNLAQGNEIIFSDGATWEMETTKNGYYASTNPSTNNTLRVLRGASLSVPICLYVGYKDECGNAVEVADGGSLAADSLILKCVRQRLSVSNATVRIKGELGIGKAATDNFGTDGCRLEIAGTNSLVTVDGTLNVLNHSVVDFDLPPTGFAATPIVANSISVSDNSLLTANLSNYIDKMTGSRADITLATATGSLTVSSSALAASNALLPEKCEFHVDGKDLKLRVYKKTGLILIFR